MLFGIFGNKKNSTVDNSKTSNEIQNKINSERKLSSPNSSSKTTNQKSPGATRPAPNGCADIATRED